MKKCKKEKEHIDTVRAFWGFTLIEILVAVAIIVILSGAVFAVIGPVRERARDTRRKSDISQLGRFMVLTCFVPDKGEGEYDLFPVMEELKEKNPRVAGLISRTPLDPSKGTANESFYRYVVEGKKCALYANLENKKEEVTLKDSTEPKAGGGTGVLQAGETGWNGSANYFQVSN